MTQPTLEEKQKSWIEQVSALDIWKERIDKSHEIRFVLNDKYYYFVSKTLVVSAWSKLTKDPPRTLKVHSWSSLSAILEDPEIEDKLKEKMLYHIDILMERIN